MRMFLCVFLILLFRDKLGPHAYLLFVPIIMAGFQDFKDLTK